MKTYPSLEARIICAHLDSMPDFSPAKSADADRDEQARFYAFVKAVYARAAENPGILGLTNLHEDDAHPNRFNKSSYGKPALAADIRRAADAVDAFFSFLAEVGAQGTVYAETDALVLPENFKIPKKHQNAMEAVGLRIRDHKITSEKWPGIFRAWKMLSYPCEGDLALRQRVQRMKKCVFVENTPGLRGTFSRLIGEGAESLTAWLEAHGYVRETVIVNKEITALRYVKNGVGAQFMYDYQTKTPAYMTLIQREWRALLPKYDAMGRTLKALIAEKNGRCSHCGYCTQRSGGKARPYAVTVQNEGEEMTLCPLFPQYSYVFETLDAKKVAGLIECLRFMENNLPNEKQEKQEYSPRMFRL